MFSVGEDSELTSVEETNSTAIISDAGEGGNVEVVSSGSSVVVVEVASDDSPSLAPSLEVGVALQDSSKFPPGTFT